MEARAKNRKWMTEAVIPSLSDEGRIAVIGTVISEDCFLYWAKGSPSWHTLWYSIWDDEEKSIWEERFPRERILDIKNEFEAVGNANGFYQEYMNIAQSPDNAPFKPEWIKLHHYDFERIAGQGCLTRKIGDEIEEIPIDVYCGVDPASSLSITADFFVVVAIGVDNENNKYMLDCFRKRISPADQPQTIIDMFKKYRPRRLKIETTGYQEALRTAVREIMLKDSLYIPGIEKGVKPRTRKSERLMSLVPMFAKGQFYIRPEDTAAQQEFLSYPKGKHDDVMDAVWTALDGHKPCRSKKLDKDHENDNPIKKVLDWLTM
jgi:predicted phage terminase large subunit-like protein